MKNDTSAAIAKIDSQLTEAKQRLEVASQAHTSAKKRVAQLEELRKKLDSPEDLIAYAVDRLLSEEAGTGEASAKPEQERAKKLTPELKQALIDGVVSFLKEKADWTGAGDVKAAFEKLPNAGKRYSVIVAELVAAKKIAKRGALVKTEYKAK